MSLRLHFVGGMLSGLDSVKNMLHLHLDYEITVQILLSIFLPKTPEFLEDTELSPLFSIRI